MEEASRYPYLEFYSSCSSIAFSHFSYRKWMDWARENDGAWIIRSFWLV